MKCGINKTHKRGFTLAELLTTLAVIGVLLGLLIPALNEVSKSAAKVKQKAQLHAIGLGLESFRNDFGDYPPSAWDTGTFGLYSASQRLAEALIGRDGLGFHSKSLFQSNGMADVNRDGTLDVIYGDPSGYTAETPEDNLAARKGSYLEVESANAVELSSLLSPLGFPNLSPTVPSYVLVDNFKVIKNAVTGKEVGMPILYYRANKMRIGNNSDETEWANNTFNFQDGYCEGLGLINSSTVASPDTYVEVANEFYNAILNPNFTSPARPYRADSYLLQSAGPDGLYGTVDDIFNFDQDN